MIKDNLIFLKECFRDFQSTGTVWPTSHWAAQALTSPLRGRNGHNSALKILEIGPGTGSVTLEILKLIQPQDEFTICEINPRFLRALQKRLELNSDFKRNKSSISFFEGPVQNLPEDKCYDVIVCAVPFLNLPAVVVQEIFQKLARISHQNTTMTFYEYIGLRLLGKLIPIKQRQDRIRQLDVYYSKLFKLHLKGRHKVWLNVLPVNVYSLKDLPSICHEANRPL